MPRQQLLCWRLGERYFGDSFVGVICWDAFSSSELFAPEGIVKTKTHRVMRRKFSLK